MRDRIVIAATCFLVIGSAVANAQTYASITGGAAFLSDWDVDVPPVGDVEAKFDTGFNVTGALGYVWQTLPLGDLRAEVEVGYRHNDFKQITVLGVNQPTDGTDIRSLSGMLNVARFLHRDRG